MKKIISLLSVFAMICTLFTSVALADESNKFYWEEVEKTNTSLTLKLIMETNLNIASSSGTHDITEALANGAKVTVTKLDSTVFSVNTTAKVISWSITSVEGVTGKIDLGTVTFDLTNLTASFSLPAKRAYTAKDTAKQSVIDSFTNDAVGYTVTKPTTTPTAKAAVAGKAIEDGFKTFSTDAAIEFAVGATPTIEISKSGTTDKLTETLKSDVIGEGKTKIIPIVSYKIGRNGVAGGDIFTIKVTNGTDTSSWTYTVPAE